MPVYIFNLADDTQTVDDNLADEYPFSNATVNPDLMGERIKVNTLHFCKLKRISPAPGCIEQTSQSLIFLLQGGLGLYRASDFQQLL